MTEYQRLQSDLSRSKALVAAAPKDTVERAMHEAMLRRAEVAMSGFKARVQEETNSLTRKSRVERVGA